MTTNVAATTPVSPTQRPARWFHFRGRVLLVIPLAILVLALIYVPRQIAQHRALEALKQSKAVVRTQPIVVPGAAQLFGEEYAQEIVEVYLVEPQHSARSVPRSRDHVWLRSANCSTAVVW